MKYINYNLLRVVAIYMISISPAYAYLDPGTGSLIIQMAIAGLLGFIYTLKIYWSNFKTFINRMLGREVTEEANDEEKELKKNKKE